jgi:HD-like signal output (HDOD) protein
MSFVDEVVAGRVELPMLPKGVIEVLKILRRDDASLADVASHVQNDPVLAARVLRMANSSYFGGRRSVSSLTSAVMMIGVRPLTTLLVACGAQAVFAQTPGVNLRRFWEASYQTASAARQLAGRLRLDRETAYSAGLLAGVGHLILCRFHAEEAERRFGGVLMPWGAVLAQQEREAFLADHARIAGLWTDKLELPEPLVRAVGMSQAPLSDTAPAMARVVQLAAEMAAEMAAVLDGADADDPSLPSRWRTGLPATLLAGLGLTDYLADGSCQEDVRAMRDTLQAA